jgi:hypothetical protein
LFFFIMIATMTRTTNIRHGRHLFLFLLPTFFLPHFALVGGIRRAPPLTVQEELGISPTLSLFLADKAFFDPLNIATDDNFAFLREVELKHGRVSMMATIGMLVNGWPVVSPTLTNENVFLHQQVPDSILLKTSWIDVTKVMIVCAVLETQVLYQQDPQDMPGDYGVGYWFSRDKARHERYVYVVACREKRQSERK